METIVVKNDQELIESLKFYGTSAMNLQSTIIVDHLKKSKLDKVRFEEKFPKGEIFCTKEEYCFYGASYENAVNNQLIREGKEDNFIAESLPWGEWEIPNKIIKHKDQYYLRYYIDMNANYKNSEKVYHYEDGTELTDEELLVLFNEYKSEKKESEHQGTDKQIKPRNVKFAGITKIKAGGKEIVRG